MNIFPDPLNIIICEYVGRDCKYIVECLFGEKCKSYEYLYTLYYTTDIYKNIEVRYLVTSKTENLYKYKNIVYLYLAYFNEILTKDMLPPSLSVLKLSMNYNQIIECGILPTSLTHLVFGSCYNRPIEYNVLPNSLEELQFGKYFEQPLCIEILPKSLKLISMYPTYPYKEELEKLSNLLNFTIDYYD